MNDPSLAIWLYIAIIFVQFLASPTWGKVRTAITDATKQKANAASGSGAGNTQSTGTGDHT